MIKIELNQEDLERFQDRSNSLEILKEKWRKKQGELENSNADLLQGIDTLSDQLGAEKEEFKVLAIAEYDKTDQKKLIGGLGIRVGVDLIYEEKEALAWAKEHKLCLQLNKKEFEKIAKGQDIEFVEHRGKITATFPKEIKFD